MIRLLVSQTITSHSFHERIGVSDYGSIRVLAYPELRLGRRGTRERAIDELERLSPNAPLKSASLNLLYNLSRNLEALSKKTQEDREIGGDSVVVIVA